MAFGLRRIRYDHWVRGLNGDWLVSRRRYFGVPIPVWYRLDGQGVPDYANPILPDESMLPVDFQSDVPPGYSGDQRNQPDGFMGDPDIVDTWATSSLTPNRSRRLRKKLRVDEFQELGFKVDIQATDATIRGRVVVNPDHR